MEILLQDNGITAKKYDVHNNEQDFIDIKNIYQEKKKTALSNEKFIKAYGKEGSIVVITDERKDEFTSCFIKSGDTDRIEFICTENNSPVNDLNMLKFSYKLLKKFNQSNDFENIMQIYGKIDGLDDIVASFNKKTPSLKR